MSLNRREFLVRILASLSAGFLLPRLSFARPRSRVLIAGGGLAGLYAADLLKKHGFEITLLEASSRLGGKAFGGLVGGHPYDFGCQAFSKDMPRVKALGQRFGLTIAPRPQQDDFYLQDQKLFTGAELEALHKDFDVIEALGKSQYAQIDDPASRSNLAAQNVMDWARPHLQDATVDYFRSAFASEWCSVPEEVSLLHYLEYQRGYDAEGEEMDFRFREGLFRAAEGLAKEVGDRAILNCPIERVDVSTDHVRVRAGGRNFEAEYLVLAIPLMKLRAIPLRGVDVAVLNSSIAGAKNAAVRKILAVYDKPFWGTKPRQGALNLPCGMSIMDNSDADARRWSLAVFLGGPSAIENPGRDRVLERVAAVLGPEALHPLAYHEQAWLGDDYLCGGYAMNRAPVRSGSDVIPERVGDRVFIAGSEASREFPSYAEGALFSAEVAVAGIAKADRG